MSHFDLDAYDEKIRVPRDPVNPCSCTQSCMNNRCAVSAECKDSRAQYPRLFGVLPNVFSSSKTMPCGDDAEDVMREAHRLHINESTGQVYDPEARNGGWKKKMKKSKETHKKTNDKSKQKHKAGLWTFHGRNVHGHTYNIHPHVIHPHVHHGYSYSPLIRYGYSSYYPRYYHVRTSNKKKTKKTKSHKRAKPESSSSYSSYSYSS